MCTSRVLISWREEGGHTAATLEEAGPVKKAGADRVEESCRPDRDRTAAVSAEASVNAGSAEFNRVRTAQATPTLDEGVVDCAGVTGVVPGTEDDIKKAGADRDEEPYRPDRDRTAVDSGVSGATQLLVGGQRGKGFGHPLPYY